MSGRIHKSRIPIQTAISLPPLIREAIIRSKQAVMMGIERTPFTNERGGPGDGPPLPTLPNGSAYIECQIGEARPGDPRPRGKCRVVFEVHIATRRIMETYFTDEHYAKFSFVRLV